MHQSRKHMTPIFHVGQVQSIQPGPPPQLTVIFSGGSTAISNISYLASYSPQVGDFCHAIHTGKPDVPGGADWLVIGAVAQLGGWQTFSYSNSWGSISGPAAGATTAAYRLEGDVVRLAGEISGGSTATVAFTLPAGYRPTYTVKLWGQGSSGAGDYADVNVATSGAATIFYSGSVVSLDSLTFTVD
jgi:hypothetical protein